MCKLQIENGTVKFHQLVLVVFFFFSSCWHEQWEDRLASGDTGIVTHGPRSTPVDTSKYSNRYHCYDCVPSSYYYVENGTDGRALFHVKCASCHNASSKKSTGPGLMGSSDRIPSKDWLHAFIHNPQKLVKSGDVYTLRLYSENSNINHPRFKDLTDDEIDAIMDYCNPGPLLK